MTDRVHLAFYRKKNSKHGAKNRSSEQSLALCDVSLLSLLLFRRMMMGFLGMCQRLLSMLH